MEQKSIFLTLCNELGISCNESGIFLDAVISYWWVSLPILFFIILKIYNISVSKTTNKTHQGSIVTGDGGIHIGDNVGADKNAKQK